MKKFLHSLYSEDYRAQYPENCSSPKSKERFWWGILLIALILRVWGAFYSRGFIYPDELFQTLEPAHGLVFGNWIKTWEWQAGIRSWFSPYLVAALIHFFGFLGLSQPSGMITALQCTMGILSLLTVASGYRCGLHLGGPKHARLIALFLGISPVFVYYGVHPLSEAIIANFFILAFLWVVDSLQESLQENLRESPQVQRANLLKASGAGFILGIAFGIRFQSALFALGLGLIYLTAKKIRLLCVLTLTFLLVSLLTVGWIDMKTWGSFFSSPIRYFDFNIIQNGATEFFGAAPWHRYITTLGRFFSLPLGLSILFLTFLSLFRFKSNWMIYVSIGPYLIVHQLISHKEDRFIFPILPFLVLLAILSWNPIWNQKKILKWSAIALFSACTLFQYFHLNWKWNGDVTDFYTQLGKREDLRGLLACGQSVDKTGGYFYLHKKVPFQISSQAKDCPLQLIPERFNFLIFAGTTASEKLNLEMKKRNLHCSPVPELSPMLYRCEDSNPGFL